VKSRPWELTKNGQRETYDALHRGVELTVVRERGMHTLTGRARLDDVTETFSVSCTIDAAKARCVRVADRKADAAT
jgi:hypothetical protein